MYQCEVCNEVYDDTNITFMDYREMCAEVVCDNCNPHMKVTAPPLQIKAFVPPTKHIQMECSKDGHCYPECHACGLSVCKVCMGLEGTVTTHCVGRILTEDEENKIYNEGLDYVNHKWVEIKDKHPMAKTPLFED